MIEQAIYGVRPGGGYGFLAQSPGFHEDWLTEAERMCMAFGERPPNVTFERSLFAQPIDSGYVAVVQVGDRGTDDTGRPGALAFRFLVLSQQLYEDIHGDLFYLDDLFPPNWDARPPLPVLEIHEPPERRTIEQLQRVLNVPHSATLLGGIQVLVDGGRVALERNEPAREWVKSLWALLPSSSRAELWPTTYAFNNRLQFHVAIVPRVDGPDFENYVFEEQAGDYPEGRYELAVQTAIESGDQQSVDTLFARRSRSQTLRLAVILMLAFLIAPLVMALLRPPPQQPSGKATPPKKAETAAKEKPDKPKPKEEGKKPSPGGGKPEQPMLSESEVFRPLGERERLSLQRRLTRMANTLGVAPPLSESEAELQLALERIDEALGTPNPNRAVLQNGTTRQIGEVLLWPAASFPWWPMNAGVDLGFGGTGRLIELGPFKRQVRLLLWKHEVPKYNLPGPNADELLEFLERRLRNHSPNKNANP